MKVFIARVGTLSKKMLYDVYWTRPENADWPPLCRNILYPVLKLAFKIRNFIIRNQKERAQ